MSSNSKNELEQHISDVFPKTAKCHLKTYGSSGTKETLDSYCVLPMNNFNGKFYFFLWFWYLAILTWTGVFLCFRIITIASSSVRTYIFFGRAKSNTTTEINLIMKRIWFGEWFILMQLCKNMHPEIFHDLVTDLHDRFYPERSEDEKVYIRMIDNPA